MGDIVLTSFYGSIGPADEGWRERQQLLHRTAVDYGEVSRTVAWSRSDLIASEFYAANKTLLDEPRGCGYWAWKPWVILETLKAVADDDYVIYHDIGKPFRNGDASRGGSSTHGNVIELPVHSIIRWAEQHDGMFPGVNTPHYGPASQWTKRDCFIGMDCDSSAYWTLPLVQAGYNAWKKTPRVIAFLQTWLALCCDRRLISDDPNVFGEPNLPDFSEHRHDQSVFTNLIRREGITVYGSETQSTPYVRSFNYLIRRVGLDLAEQEKQETLTHCIQSNGGSNNLPIGVTSWIDLDLTGRDMSSLRFLMIRNAINHEEKIIRSFATAASWQTVDVEEIESSDRVNLDQTIDNLEGSFHWIFAYGFTDQALLCHLVRICVKRLTPMGYMIAGLDASQHFVKDATFDRLMKQLAKTRTLAASINASNQSPVNLVIGTASNPVELKKRRGKAIVASIQAGYVNQSE